MPELPEVEVVRRQLHEKVVGQTVTGVEVFHQKTVGHDASIEERLVGHTIAAVERIGKLLIFSFTDQENLFLLAHLKMTGQFFYVEGAEIVSGGGHSMTETDLAEFPGRHTRVAFRFSEGGTLYFNDLRLFGYTKVADAATVAVARNGFGPEPIDPEFAIDWFVTRIRKRKTPVKAALLDQAFVAGLGNIYVDEALWRTYIRPTRRADRLTKKEAAALGAAVGDVMRESIAVGGTTFRNFIDTGGQNGNFTDFLKVFGKHGTPCPRCSTPIKKIRCSGRGTHFCPTCQT